MSKKIVTIGAMVFLASIFLTGCGTNNLTYLGKDKDTITAETVKTSVGDLPAYPKQIRGGKISLGAFNATQAEIMGITIRIENTMKNTPLVIARTDFTVKTADNYRIKGVNPDYYISAVLGKAQQSLQTVQNQKVATNTVANTSYSSNSNAYATGYGNSASAYGNTYGTAQTTYTTQEDPYSSAGKSIGVAIAAGNAETARKYAQEVDLHALRDTMTIQPQSWDYAFLFFEKPATYPVTIIYKDTVYTFGQ